MTEIIIAGAGGCGKEVWEMAAMTFSPEQYHIKGFLSDIPMDLAGFPSVSEPAPILGTIVDYMPKAGECILLAIGSPAGRKKVAERLKAKGAHFLTMVHPTAQIFPSAHVGEGVIVYPFVFVGSQARIGDFCLFNVSAMCGHDAVVGDYSVICPSAAVLGKAVLGQECFMATNSTLAPGKKLGNRGIISANSAMLRSAEEGAFVCGVPGKSI